MMIDREKLSRIAGAWRHGWLLFGLVWLFAHGAAAQSGSAVTGTMNATAAGAVPKGAAIAVRASSGGADTRAVMDLFRAALDDSGYRTGAAADFNLTFRIAADRPRTRRGTAMELRGSEGSSSEGDVQLKMRWKATRGDAAGRRPGRRLTVSISDQDQNDIWLAHVEFQSGDADDLAMISAVMPALIANIGHSVFALRVP